MIFDRYTKANLLRMLIKTGNLEDFKSLLSNDIDTVTSKFFFKIASCLIDSNTIYNSINPFSLSISNYESNHKNITKSMTLEFEVDPLNIDYTELKELIASIIEKTSDWNFKVIPQYNKVGIRLYPQQAMLFATTLDKIRTELIANEWHKLSTAIQYSLVDTLCSLFQVPAEYYKNRKEIIDTNKREVDYYLLDTNGKKHKCEVKLMGKGNPESADAIFARDTDIFIADTLSELNKNQANNQNIKWVELRSPEGYRKFFTILQSLHIPCQDFNGDLDKELDTIFADVFKAN